MDHWRARRSPCCGSTGRKAPTRRRCADQGDASRLHAARPAGRPQGDADPVGAMAGNRPCQAGLCRDRRSRNHDRNSACRGAQGEFPDEPADRHVVDRRAKPRLHCSAMRPRDIARCRGICPAPMRRCCATSPRARPAPTRPATLRPNGPACPISAASWSARPGRGDQAGAFAFRPARHRPYPTALGAGAVELRRCDARSARPHRHDRCVRHELQRSRRPCGRLAARMERPGLHPQGRAARHRPWRQRAGGRDAGQTIRRSQRAMDDQWRLPALGALGLRQCEALEELQHRLVEARRRTAAAAAVGCKHVEIARHGGAGMDWRAGPVAATHVDQRCRRS